MKEFMILMFGKVSDWKKFGPEENQKLMEQYFAFVNELKQGDGFVGGSQLAPGGFELRPGKKGALIDGPFAETKEVINGYMIFKAKNFDHALEIAKKCPALTHGETVQVFALNEEGP